MSHTSELTTIGKRETALVIMAATVAESKDLAMDLRNEFNSEDRFTALIKIAFPETANLEPGALDGHGSILSKYAMAARLERLSNDVPKLDDKAEAALACIVLLKSNGWNIAQYALEEFNSGSPASIRVELAFPALAVLERGEADSYDLSDHNVDDINEAAAKIIAAANDLGLPN